MELLGKTYKSQWAGQYFVAAELTRRGYLVSITLGNAKHADLMGRSPFGSSFIIDVKSQSSKNFWLISEKDSIPPDLYYVMVYLPSAPASPEYFIMHGEEVMALVRALREKSEATGHIWKPSGAGMNWTTPHSYKDRWDVLPQ